MKDGGAAVGSFIQDLRYGTRLLSKSAGFTAIAVLTLALGIGANTAIFSVVNAVLLRPLRYKDPERLVMLAKKDGSGAPHVFSPEEFRNFRDQSRSFEQMAGLFFFPFSLTGMDEPEQLSGCVVSTTYLQMLGLNTFLGRTFLPEEERLGHGHVVVLSYSFWQRKFGADPNIVGRQIQLNNEDYTIVGVLQPGVDDYSGASLWAPLVLERYPAVKFMVIGRLRSGVALKQARAEVETILRNFALERHKREISPGAVVVSLREQIVKGQRPALLLLLTAVGLVLLIACVNVANLLMSRAATREREISIRAALGAGRLRLVRQLLVESLLLALLAAGAGLLLARWGVRALLAWFPDVLFRVNETRVDARALAFTLGISLLTTIVFGLAPALAASRRATVSLTRTFSQRSRATASRMLVVGEVALAVVLLTAAGLLIRSLFALRTVPPGFQPQHVFTMQLSLPEAKYSNAHQIGAFYRQVLVRLQSLPGVQSVAAATHLPFGGGLPMDEGIVVEGRPARPGEAALANLSLVTPGYFSTMGIPLLKGRFFREQDTAGAPRVTIISQGVAHRFFAGEGPLGKHLLLATLAPNLRQAGQKVPHEIIGVVGDVRESALGKEPNMAVYMPYMQNWLPFATLAVRTAAPDPAAFASAVRREIRAIDPEQPVFRERTLEDYISGSLSRPRLNAALLAVFAALALLLAAIGVYGVVSYSVAQRTREIGVRMALGAQRGDVLRLVFRQGMKLVLLGVGAGLAASFAVTRVLSGLLYGVKTSDPMTFTVVAMLLTVVALLAIYIPAHCATRIDPMTALRYDD